MLCCSFIGHKDCPSEVKLPLFNTVERLVTQETVTRFYVGTQRHFDRLAYEVLCDLEKKHKIQTFVVLAYLNRAPVNQYYDADKTIFPDELTKTPYRYAIRKRNSFMIDRSDYVVSYLNTPFSNTCGNVEEALRKKKQVINLGIFDIEALKKAIASKSRHKKCLLFWCKLQGRHPQPPLSAFCCRHPVQGSFRADTGSAPAYLKVPFVMIEKCNVLLYNKCVCGSEVRSPTIFYPLGRVF